MHLLPNKVLKIVCHAVGFDATWLIPLLPIEMGWTQAANQPPEPLYSGIAVEFSMPELIQDGPGENVRWPYHSQVVIR
jgi:hypothetical protein